MKTSMHSPRSNVHDLRRQPSPSAIASLALAAALTMSAPAVTQAASPINVVEITIPDIQLGLASGTYTAVDLLNAHLDRINLYEPHYNAFTFFSPTALAEAEALDAEYAISGPRSPLHGVPIVIKEAMDVKGLPSTVGYAPYSSAAGGVDLIPETDAPVVARLREAGAVIIGKTNIPAFSFSGTRASTSWDGDTYNAYDRSIAPGGSSSGTATAVSASFAVIGTAEETGGSIQNPAAAQNLVSVKPSFGLTPNAGVAPLSANTRDVIGPHARTVYDAAVTLDVMAGYTVEDPKTLLSVGNMPSGGYTSELSDTALQGKRFGLFGEAWGGDSLTAETQVLYDAAMNVMLSEGATLVADPFVGTSFRSLIASTPNGFAGTAYEFDQFLDRLGPSAAANSVAELLALTGVDPFAPGQPLQFIGSSYPFETANPTVPPDLTAFFESRVALLEVFDQVMADNDLDGLVFPQMWKKTPQLASSENIGATTVSEINLLGTPGVTVPAGYYDDGVPFSLIFLGEMWSEAELLGYAFDFEQATLLRAAPTLVPIPAALPLLGSALLVLFARRRRPMSTREQRSAVDAMPLAA